MVVQSFFSMTRHGSSMYHPGGGKEAVHHPGGKSRQARHPKRQKRCPNEGSAIHVLASTARSFIKDLRSKYSSYTSECCRLLLPTGFCRKYKVKRGVTMTDSAGHKLWHMRFQYGAWFRHPRQYIISNGWREFSYEHSLKVNDRLLFTTVTSSHFVVEFATLNCSIRAMFQTRDRKAYPRSMNYPRLDCLASANRKDKLQAVKEKQIQEKTQVVKEKQSQKKTPVVKEKMIQKRAQVVKETEIRQKMTSIILPDKQELQKETFCQCNTVGHGKNTKAHSMKDYVFPEFTHVECKNPDGSIYLQILDSDSEISGINDDD